MTNNVRVPIFGKRNAMPSLILFRHSDAVASASSDFERRLTERGREKLRLIAEEAKSLLPSVDRILSSPYLRAMESAQILAEAYGVDPAEVQSHDPIANALPREIIQLLKAYSGSNILLVGHMPTLAYLSAELLSDGVQPMNLNFSPGHFLLMDFDGKFLFRKGRLRHFYSGAQPR